MRSVTALVLGCALASCGGSGDTTTTPTTPTTVIDTFTGTLASGGSNLYPFTVTTAGVLTATLTSFTPQTTITLGFGLGQPVNGVCNLISNAYTESARSGQVLSGTIAAGSYCVVIYDIGNVQGTDDYTITISHS